MPPYGLPDYHERSKHRLDRYAPGPGGLDWANQPDPFRTFAGAPTVELPLGADSMAVSFDDLRNGGLPRERPIDLDSIGALFELSLALSAWKSYGGTTWALRCNPSSGNLHPTEGYLLSGGAPGLPAGVYHYVSRDHLLERRGEWRDAPRVPGLIVGLSSIYWREAWKYGMRGFRYCQHDCGHAIAALSYAASALGWRAELFAWPGRDDIERLLGLDRAGDFEDAERESPECLLWLGASGTPPVALPPPPERWSGRANRLSAESIAWPDIERVERLSRKPRTEPQEARAVSAASPLGGELAANVAAASLIRQRRSAVAFDGITRISARTLCSMLEATLPRAAPPWSAWPWPAAVHLALFVHRVDGLEPGLYCLVRDASALDSLKAAMRNDWLWRESAQLPLYLLIPCDLRDAARLICCHQDIAADSCFALGMLADFALAQREPWRYRQLYWECGLVGQALYLEAEAAGIRATGIGCFFDDEMHSLLGLRTLDWQSLYHFTAGGPVEDARLATLAPYSFGRPRSPANTIK